MRRRAWPAAAGVVAAATLVATFSAAGSDSVEVARGRALYADHCASCHGGELEGQPDWQERLPGGRLPAPPHDATGHTWHHPDEVLFRIVRNGVSAIVPGYESDMPAFAGTLSDEEIRAVLAFIKSTWPERARAYQAAATEAAK